MNILEAIIIAIVEGLTEFLPISSTGHMVITSSLLGISPNDEFSKMFMVVIQLGAILSVVVLYYKKFFDFARWQFYLKLVVAVLPALAFGALFSSRIKVLMGSNLTVAIALLLGGIVLLFIDNVFKKPKYDNDSEVSYMRGFTIGMWQVIAMIPGVSRSAASIIGGMQQGLSRRLAAEFSFFLAVPTMFAATSKDLYDWYKLKGTFTAEEVKMLVVGNIVAFIVALLAIKFFISFLQKNGFRVFGWYRIIVGIALLVLIFTGYLR
jgi:undecaprenyl-diphosphatase